MILIRAIYITAIAWCLFLFVICLYRYHPEFCDFRKIGFSDDDMLHFIILPLLVACFGIAYRFIRQEEQK